MIKGAVFDMDGLMFDTERLTFDAWHKTMTANGFKYDLSIFKQTIGNRTTETKVFYTKLFGENFNYDKMREEANIIFRDEIKSNGVPVKKGLYNILQFLKDNNFKIALATSTSSSTAMKLLDNAQTKYFDKFICGNMVQKGKPNPEVFLTAAKELQLKPCECIALEDSINGIKSAYFAGMKPIMVPDYLKPTPEIEPMIFALCNNLNEAIQYFS